ncbi:NAD(P)H-dependent oxidoreductase [Pleionea sp. CnH1-48]|uniref:NAD(P)H-dependent oxidoreductase n=1 Tax=Pleionea sp. CnH1-48 TaxID=2954494 RepID=UPI002096BAA2|nr:NAD(P)H-dependent oxidoreductase [Pleionea sp. CnH1-48]
MNVYIINAHHHYPFSEGKLNRTFVDKAISLFEGKGHRVKVLNVDDGYDVQQELSNHQWADFILLQSPVNWMGMPWPFKKYMDEVYTAGMSGELCNGDGRSREDASKHYGAGGTLTNKSYMLSLTFNAPKEAFDDPEQFLFQGKGVEDLMFPMHMNFRFFGMTAHPTFMSNDVMKNPDIENDLNQFIQHINQHILGE